MTTSKIVELHDPSTGANARILTSFGFNCFEFRGCVDGESIDVLWSEDRFETGQCRASGSGIPILFPFPGRIQGTKFSWKGRGFPLEAGDGRGNAIHGFVHDRPWRVIEQSKNHVVGQFQASVDDATLLDHWPSDFCVTATYSLEKNCLRCTFLIENRGDEALPCGLGTHPYFNVPLGKSGSAAETRVSVPVRQQWELAGMVATGKRLPLDDADRYAQGLAFPETTFDNVFTDLCFDDGQFTSQVRDQRSGRTMTMTFDQAFRECVVYNPPHREAICIEPYTCVPDAARLAEAGIDAGLRILQPGDCFHARVDIRVS